MIDSNTANDLLTITRSHLMGTCSGHKYDSFIISLRLLGPSETIKEAVSKVSKRFLSK